MRFAKINRLNLLGRLLAIGSAAAVWLWLAPDDVLAQAPKPIDGTWEGKLKVNEATELRVVLKVAKPKGGKWNGTFQSPDQSPTAIPVDTITRKQDELSFEVKEIKASYAGKLNAKGTELVGEFRQGGAKFPLTLTRADPAKVAAAAPKIRKELEGAWEGKLKVNGGIELRVVLRVAKPKGGGDLAATLDSPDQGANDIVVSSIALDKDVLTFESKAVGAKYSGKLNKAMTEAVGEFKQGPGSLPLTLKRTDKPTEVRRPQLPRKPYPYIEEEVRYENVAGDVTLAGTLTIPKGKGPFPSVLLITGSGAQDRDESLLGHKPFLVLADALTRRGIVVLRVDDRGVGGSTGGLTEATSMDFATDVEAGIAFLKTRPEVDRANIGLIGHSEGGLIAPIVAARSDDVAFIVLMAGTGLTGAEILELQSALIAKAGGAKDEQIKMNAEAQKAVFAILATEKDPKLAETKMRAAMKKVLDALTDAEKKEIGDPTKFADAQIKQLRSPWFRFFLTFDPRPVLAKVKCPVLAINGANDLQVPPKENLREIEKALKSAGNKKVTVKEIPKLNHLFQTSETGAPSEYAMIEETFSPVALKIIGDWILDQGGKP